LPTLNEKAVEAFDALFLKPGVAPKRSAHFLQFDASEAERLKETRSSETPFSTSNPLSE
jgi:hypothetical protein